MGKRIAIVGSRGFKDLMAVRLFVLELDLEDTIISGNARGVDYTAEQMGYERGMKVLSFPAEWEKYGKRAGFVRNRVIVEAADEVVAFWDGGSKGTAHTISLAQEMGKPVRIIRERGQQGSPEVSPR